MDGSEISPMLQPPETESRCRDIKEMAIVRLVRIVNQGEIPVVGLCLIIGDLNGINEI